jgi:hypothetical protein
VSYGECCFSSTDLANNVQLATAFTASRPDQLLFDFLAEKNHVTPLVFPPSALRLPMRQLGQTLPIADP